MQLEWYEHFADGCFRDTPPPCSSSCPLGLDVRKFADRAGNGKWNSAYRVYREHVLFPGIVSTVCHAPCRGTCVRANGECASNKSAGYDADKAADHSKERAADRAVDLKLIEQACVEKAGGKPRKFKLPEKPERIAVVGAGMDGLSCALRLVSHGYPVTIFDMNTTPGGRVLEMMDPEACRADIEMSFSVYDEASFRLGTKVSSLDELSEYNAVYIAVTGAWRDEITAAERDGLFITAAEDSSMPVTERMACGLNAADHIEFWFQLGDKAEYTRLYGSEEPDHRYYGLHYGTREEDEESVSGAGDEATSSSDGAGSKKKDPSESISCNEIDGSQGLSPEAEAARCWQCNCEECYKVCPVMQREKQFPQRMTAYVIGTLWPNMTRRPGVKMLTGCTMCGKCGDACPENIDMGECLREARKDFYNSGHFAPAYHDYWMQELEFVQSDEAYLLYTGKKGIVPKNTNGTEPEGKAAPRDHASAVFFPGCQLGASDPELVIRSYEFLQRTCEGPALLLSCCGVTAEWAGDDKTRTEITDRIRDEWKALGEPVFITGCSACKANLGRYLPEIEVVSLYRWMADHKDALPHSMPDRESEEVRSASSGSADGTQNACKAVIYDPCGSDGDEDTKAAVRELAKTIGMTVTEAGEGTMPVCCGFGGHIYPANPDLFDAMKPDLPEGAELTVYCANCRDAFVSKGCGASHILEKVFGLEKADCRAADPTERRANRRKLRAFYTGEEIVEEERRYCLAIPEEMREKLERMLILEEQVYETLEQAEDTKEKFLDREAGLYYASRRFRNMTVWISYREDQEGGFTLEDVYRHRVEIKE